MGKIEGLQKEIDKIDRVAKFVQNILLALASGIIWTIYALMEDKADTKIIVLSSVGFVVFIFMLFYLIFKNKKQEELIKKLYKED